MIGNRHLMALFQYPDEDAALNQLLEFLAYNDAEFMAGLVRDPVDVDLCNEAEIQYLTKASALIDYYLQLHGTEVPGWLRDPRLCFDKPYYHPRRLTGFEAFRLLFTSPGPFKRRNVYFDLEGIRRV